MTQTQPTQEQLRFIEKTAKAQARTKEMADEADALGLITLAREWDYLGKCLEGALGNQLRVFREASLLNEETLLIDRETTVSTKVNNQLEIGFEERR